MLHPSRPTRRQASGGYPREPQAGTPICGRADHLLVIFREGCCRVEADTWEKPFASGGGCTPGTPFATIAKLSSDLNSL